MNIMSMYSYMNKRRHRGVAMVELALILPLLLTIFFGIVELGRALYQQNMLAKSVANSTRMLARVYDGLDVDSGCITNSDVWPQAVTDAENFLRYGNSSGTGDLRLPDISLDSVDITAHDNDGSDAGDYICSIKMTGQSTFIPLISDVFGIGEFTLRASAEERYIGE